MFERSPGGESVSQQTSMSATYRTLQHTPVQARVRLAATPECAIDPRLRTWRALRHNPTDPDGTWLPTTPEHAQHRMRDPARRRRRHTKIPARRVPKPLAFTRLPNDRAAHQGRFNGGRVRGLAGGVGGRECGSSTVCTKAARAWGERRACGAVGAHQKRSP